MPEGVPAPVRTGIDSATGLSRPLTFSAPRRSPPLPGSRSAQANRVGGGAGAAAGEMAAVRLEAGE